MKYGRLLEEVIRGGTTRIDAVPELIELKGQLTYHNVSYIDIADIPETGVSHCCLEFLCEARFEYLTIFNRESPKTNLVSRPSTVHVHEISDSLKTALYLLAFKAING